MRTASAVWRFGEETLVSDPSSGGALIAPPFFFVPLVPSVLQGSSIQRVSHSQDVSPMNRLILEASFVWIGATRGA